MTKGNQPDRSGAYRNLGVAGRFFKIPPLKSRRGKACPPYDFGRRGI
jgi:hypothetical protein